MASETETPRTSWRAILARSGAREATEQEWRDFLAEYGPHMLPPDDEGILPDPRPSERSDPVRTD